MKAGLFDFPQEKNYPRLRMTIAAAALLWTAASAWAQPPAPPYASTEAVKAPALRLLPADELPEFADTLESRKGLVQAAKRTLAYLEKYAGPKYIRIGDRDYGAAALADSVAALLELLKAGPAQDELNAHIRRSFDVYLSPGSDGTGQVLFYGYDEPVLGASLKESPQYPYPLYKRPQDMVEAEPGLFDKKYNGEALVGRIDKAGRFVPYFSREEIDVGKALAGKGLEIAWLKNQEDGLNLRARGSAILRFPSGREMLARYAARNPRYAFFSLTPLPDREPAGEIGQPLVPERSIAVDPASVPLGALAYIETVSPQADKEGRLLGRFPNSRFALCMDAGSSLKGHGRAGIYAGHGNRAETIARNQSSEGRLYILLKKIPPRER